ncbi:MAG TPA: UDP-2,3-diacylglucosamine diphosphatase [Casimicrobiaceae bacterium]|nr:UDP-2,3-diacylglucosamine diphosphatase [Casimicrobiaceae bacterium]
MPSGAPTLFLSDLHLSPERPEALRAFHAFAAGPAREAAAVYLLGDVFDWWVGDDQMREPFVARIVESLRGIADAGVPLYIAHGNRDFLMGPRLAAAAGATLVPEYVVLDLHGIRTVLCHGDSLCTDDVDYQAYRARMRNPAMQARLLRLPYFLRRIIARWLQRKSRDMKALKPESIMDVAPDTVAATFRRHDAQRMIHGHTHRPARHEVDVDGARRERYVLADWHDRGRYLAVDEGGANEREIVPQRRP